MDDNLLKRAQAVREAVDNGKQQYAAAKREYEVNQRLFNEALDEAKEKFGVKTLDELQVKASALDTEISSSLDEIVALLAEAGITVGEPVEERYEV